jgi:hypothetical protein
MFAGVLCGRLLDAGYLRLQISIGMLLQFVGLILASFSTQYWQLLLSQGLCVGLGAGFLYLPSVVVVSQYFSSRIMLATGIVATGSSAGKSLAISSCLAQDDNAEANGQSLIHNRWNHLPHCDSQAGLANRLQLDHAQPSTDYTCSKWCLFGGNATSHYPEIYSSDVQSLYI